MTLSRDTATGLSSTLCNKDLKVESLFNVHGKIALVTGGSSGIGKMIASALVANGAKVYIASRGEEQLNEATDELNAGGPGSCHYIVADISTKAGCDALISSFNQQESKLHILVNNSGVTWAAPYDDFPETEGWDEVMGVNVKSIFYMTVGLTALLEKDSTADDPGRVINVSSAAGVSAHAEITAMPELAMGLWSYNTSKAAVNHLTSQLAVTLAKRYITVNAILPGVFPSKMTEFGIQAVGEDKIAATMPMGRLGTPRDMGGLLLFLCSQASAHVTGAHILVDGGVTLVGAKVAPSVKL